jgi:hypothetical protein
MMKLINKPNLFRPLGFLALFVICASLKAQTTNRFSVDYQTLGSSDSVSTSGVSAKVAHRVFLDEEGENLLTVGLGFSQVQLEDPTQLGVDRNRELRTLVPDLNLMKILNEEYSMVLSLRPGFYGSLKDNLGNDFRLEGGVVITKFITENLTMGLGLGRGTNFGRDLVVPLFQFVYFANEKVIMRGLLPIRASVWYIPTQDWELGVIYRLQGSLYNLEETNIPGARQLGFAAAHVGVGANYKAFGNNFISAEAGVTAIRRYQWTNEDKTSFKISEDPWRERDLGRVPYLKIGFIQKF